MTELPSILIKITVETGEKNIILDIQINVYSLNNVSWLLKMEFHPDLW